MAQINYIKNTFGRDVNLIHRKLRTRKQIDKLLADIINDKIDTFPKTLYILSNSNDLYICGNGFPKVMVVSNQVEEVRYHHPIKRFIKSYISLDPKDAECDICFENIKSFKVVHLCKYCSFMSCSDCICKHKTAVRNTIPCPQCNIIWES